MGVHHSSSARINVTLNGCPSSARFNVTLNGYYKRVGGNSPTLIMAHLSYEDLRRTGVLSTEATALQYCINTGIVRPHQFCEACYVYMELTTCSTSKYSEGYCWTCPGRRHQRSVRINSVLEKRTISFSSFLHLLWMF